MQCLPRGGDRLVLTSGEACIITMSRFRSASTSVYASPSSARCRRAHCHAAEGVSWQASFRLNVPVAVVAVPGAVAVATVAAFFAPHRVRAPRV